MSRSPRSLPASGSGFFNHPSGTGAGVGLQRDGRKYGLGVARLRAHSIVAQGSCPDSAARACHRWVRAAVDRAVDRIKDSVGNLLVPPQWILTGGYWSSVAADSCRPSALPTECLSGFSLGDVAHRQTIRLPIAQPADRITIARSRRGGSPLVTLTASNIARFRWQSSRYRRSGPMRSSAPGGRDGVCQSVSRACKCPQENWGLRWGTSSRLRVVLRPSAPSPASPLWSLAGSSTPPLTCC